MRTLLSILLLLPALAQAQLLNTDMSDRSRPRQPGEFVLKIDSVSGELYRLGVAGPAQRLRLRNTDVIGLAAQFSGYSTRQRTDSLLSLRAPLMNYYPTNISNVLGLQDTIRRYLLKSEYQMIAGDTNKTGYLRSESNALFAAKAPTATALDQRAPAMLIATLRASGAPPQAVYVTDAGKAGTFLYDPLDTSTPDNGGTVLVAGGKRFKRTGYREVQTAWFCKGDSATDDTDNLKAAVSALSTGVRVLYINSGTPRVTKATLIPAGVQVIMSPTARLIASPNFQADVANGSGQDGKYFFNVQGDNVEIYGGTLDGKGQGVGGVMAANRTNVRVNSVTIKNLAGANFGVGLFSCTSSRILYCNITDVAHGINNFRTDGIVVQGNILNRCYSGIYTAASVGSTIQTNRVSNCVDVGIDLEGGIKNTVTGNYAERCGNGEFAMFSGGSENYAYQGTPHDNIFSANVAVRLPTYVTSLNANGSENLANINDAYGAFSFQSLAPGTYNSGFIDNTAYVNFGPAISHYQATETSNKYLFVTRNTIYTDNKGRFGRAVNSDGLSVTYNSFTSRVVQDSTTNEFRDGHRLEVIGNRLEYQNGKAAGRAMLINTSGTFATIAPRVENNTILGAGTLAMQVDLFQNPNLKPRLMANVLGDTYVANGGLDITANGKAVLINQALKVLLPQGDTNLNSAVPAMDDAKTGPSKTFGSLIAGRNGTAHLLADFAWASDVGGFFRTYNSPSGISVSGSGATVTLSNSTGSTIQGSLDIIVNTYTNP